MPRYAYQNHFVDGNGTVVPGGTVTVYLTGTSTLATIYESSTGAATSSSQLTTDSNDGSFKFYVDTSDHTVNQKFRIVLSKTNFRSQTYDDVAIFPDQLGVGVVSLEWWGAVGDDPPGIFPRPTAASAGHRDRLDGRFQQRYFRRRGRRQAASERNTLAVHHHHPLRTLPTFGLADARAPLFAGAKLPSAKVSSQFSRPWASNSPINTRHTRCQTPWSSHCCNRRQQVLYEGYRSGKSFHRAPDRNTQRMPSKTCRLSIGLGPPLGDALILGNNGSILRHCSSVSSVGSLAMCDSFRQPRNHKMLHGANL